MSKAKAGVAQSKAPEKKAFKAEDYASLTIPVEEVRDIKTAFDIFDGDLSGVVDPQELKRAFEQLGFQGDNKFVYQILAELDDDQSGGIDFAEFLRLATAKLSDKDSRAEVDKVWTSFDINKAVRNHLFRERSLLLSSRKSQSNLEKNSLKMKFKTFSPKLILMMMDSLPLTIFTTSLPIKFTGNNDQPYLLSSFSTQYTIK
jgi:Ca2+-binding EF-hand superfamily protein